MNHRTTLLVLLGLLGAAGCARSEPSHSPAGQIASQMQSMDDKQAALDQSYDQWQRALRDPALAFSDSTSLAIARAADAGNSAEVARLVAQGGRLDAHGLNDLTILQWMVLHDNPNGVAVLLDAGARPDQPGLDGRTAISVATGDDTIASLRVLLDHHANLEATDSGGNTALMYGLSTGADLAVDMLLAAGANVNHPGALGRTPLMVAASANAFPRVLQLLNMGADPLAKNSIHVTFQRYLVTTPRNTMTADARAQLDKIDDWLRAHNVPIEDAYAGRTGGE